MTSTDGASVGDKYMLSRGFSASVRYVPACATLRPKL